MLTDSIPHAAGMGDPLTDPISFLIRAHARHGNLFAIRKEGPVFSRVAECAGVVAALGVENQRAILVDTETFGLPISAAEKLKLPQNLVNLNRSLHSMRGAEHAAHKRLLITMLNHAVSPHRPVWEALEEVTGDWIPGPVHLVEQIRELVFHASFRVLFGYGGTPTLQLARLLQMYFHLRREAAAAGTTPTQELLQQVVLVGNMLDSQLREFIRERRQATPASTGGVFGILASESRNGLSQDEIAGHMNIFFISTTEPVAVALAWVLLVLSQLPELRLQLRNEMSATLVRAGVPAEIELNRLILLDSVISETLRLLPPNALMVRITAQPASLSGFPLPNRCEVVLSPFVSHRDEAAFPRPQEFRLSRWRGKPFSPYLYFPFGAGGHSCIGRGIALGMIRTALAFMLPRFDVILVEDQKIDCAIRIMLTPNPDPRVVFHPLPVPAHIKSGAIKGSLAKILNLTGVGTTQ
jgi:cytochrome P450